MALQYPSSTMNGMLRANIGLEVAYDYVRNDLPYEKTIARLGRIGLTAETTLAEVHLQQAVWSPGEADTMLDRAEAVLEKRVYSGEQGFDLRATTRLAQIPIYRSLLGNPKFPEAKTVIQAQYLMLDAAGIAVNHDAYEQQEPSRKRHVKVGMMSETAVLLLLNRFAILSELPQDWLPVSSFLAEDLGPSAGTAGWDISIYLPSRKGRPELGYKVQVKSSLHATQTCAKDIAMVIVSHGLTTTNEVSTTSAQIIKECRRAERRDSPPKVLLRNIGERTDKLLTILDQAK